MKEEEIGIFIGGIAVLILIFALGITITGFVTLGDILGGPDNPDTSNLDDLFTDDGANGNGNIDNTNTQDNQNQGNTDTGNDDDDDSGTVCAQVITTYYVLENNACVSKQNSDSCIPENGFLTLSECEKGIVVLPTCQSQCSFGARECAANGFRECVDNNGDGCFEWQSENCGTSQKCIANGQCINLCSEENWVFTLKPIECPSNGKQAKNWKHIGNCVEGIQKPDKENVVCQYQAPICKKVKYTTWGECLESGVQKREIREESLKPEGCVVSNPETTQSCEYLPNCAESNWNKFESVCSVNGKKIITWTKVGKCENGIQKPNTEQVSCVYQAPTCKSDGFVYTLWSECKRGGYTERAVVSKSPENCVGGNPLIKEVCNYVPPCTENQIISCGSVSNGYFDGYHDICKNDESGWKGENTCKVICDEGYEKNWDKCVKKEIIENYRDEIDSTEIVIDEQEDTSVQNNEINEVTNEIQEDLEDGNTEIDDSKLQQVVNIVEDALNEIVDRATTEEEREQIVDKVEDEVREIFSNNPNITREELEIITQNVVNQVNSVLSIKKDTVVKINEKIVIRLSKEKNQSEIGNISIKRSSINENREYIIIRNLTLSENESKTIYLQRKDIESNAVCFRDERGVKELKDIIASCQKLACPGVLGRYTCAFNQSSGEFIISGMKHSGVVEDKLKNGDGICSPEIGESCAFTHGDCGVCPNIQTAPPEEDNGSGGNRASNDVRRESSGGNAGSKNADNTEQSGEENSDDVQGILDSSGIEETNTNNENSNLWKKWKNIQVLKFIENNLILFIIGIIALMAMIILLVLIKIIRKNTKMEAQRIYIKT